MRPLTNCNVVLDFHRYEDAAYYTLALRYLRSLASVDPRSGLGLGLGHGRVS